MVIKCVTHAPKHAMSGFIIVPCCAYATGNAYRWYHISAIASQITGKSQDCLSKKLVQANINNTSNYRIIVICEGKLLVVPSQKASIAESWFIVHHSGVIMSTIASQITSLTIDYSTLYSGADQRKHKSSASLAFVRGIHRWPVNSPHKGPVTRKMFPFEDVIMASLTKLSNKLSGCRWFEWCHKGQI